MKHIPGRRPFVLPSFLVFLLGLMLLAAASSPARAEVTILSPPSNTTILARRPLTHLLLSAPADFLPRRLTVTPLNPKSSVKLIGSWNDKNGSVIHYLLRLTPGKNVFEIEPGGLTLKVKYRPLRSLLGVNFDAASIFRFHDQENLPRECVFCHTANSADLPLLPPLPFGKSSISCYSCHKRIIEDAAWKHSPAANVLCRTCHQDETGSKRIIIPTGKVNSLCYRCHVNERNWVKMAHVHGPVGVGDCTVCHDPHGDRFSAQLWADGKKDLCLTCHVDKRALFASTGKNKILVHSIVKGAGCVACHSPHASPYRFQLYKPINKLCGSCHPQIIALGNNHPVANHPVSGRQDPLRKGRQLSCTSCHNPHGSPYRKLLIGDPVGGFVCNKCHNRQR